jgi:hypothetical protein
LTLVLDAGAFSAVEKGRRDVVALIKRERQAERSPLTHGGIVAQVWRGGRAPQAEVARLLRGVETVALGEELGRRAGVLMGRCGGSDAIDAALVCLTDDGDVVLTSDVEDLRPLALSAGVHVELVGV